MRIAGKHRVERSFGAQDGATNGFGNLRKNGVAESFDDQTGRRSPFATAECNARVSHPGGKPIIQP